MMKKKFHLAALCMTFLLTNLFSQNWYSDDAFMHYYAEGEQINLVANPEKVNIYFKSDSKTEIKNFAKSKGYLNWSKSDKVLSVDLTQYSTDFVNATPKEWYEALEISKEDVHEMVPSVKVNGRVSAVLKKEFVIKLKSDVNPHYLEVLFDRMEATIKGQRPDGSIIIGMNKVKNGFDLMHELATLDLLEYGQPDMEVQIEHTSDPLFSKQYQIQNNGGYIDGQKTEKGIDLNVVPAWEVTKGKGIKIAVLDDGIEAHEDLPALLKGYTPADNSTGLPTSTGKHGMAVAGIISAQHNSLGVKGIAPESELMGVNIFAQGTTISDYADAFYWAVENGADVINNSWGFIYEDLEVESVNPPIYTVRKGAMCSSNPFPALTSAINFAATEGRNGKGCIITFASGNWAQEGPLGQNSDECVTYPASLEKVIAIGAVNAKGDKAIYSNYGPKLDFVAPSNDLNSSGSRSYYGVRTIDREGTKGYSRSNYHSGFGGTSAATPAASGAIALILSTNKELTRQELTSLLISTSNDVETEGFDNRTGHGLIDTYAAISGKEVEGPSDPCDDRNGDSDNDGVCNQDDCQPNNADYPANPGTRCNDADPSTENDRITSDGCGCAGTPITCYDAGGDADGDGYCFIDDCDDNDPNIPGRPGARCNDGDASTTNDRITADGCDCIGEVISCYYDGGDQDGDGVCAVDDCDDENPLVPTRPGTACNDQDPDTINDVIKSDGCTCMGEQKESEDDQDNNEEENTNNDDNTNDTNDSEEHDEEEAGCIAPENLAPSGEASLSSTFFTFNADRAIDGIKNASRYAQTNYSKDPYFDLDLTQLSDIKDINIHLKSTPREDIQVFVSEKSLEGKELSDIITDETVTQFSITEADNYIPTEITGRYIRLQTAGYQSLAIIEVEVYGCYIEAQASSTDLYLEQNTNTQFDQLTMLAYPNPTQDDVFVAFENGFGKSGALFVYNSLGQVVFHQNMERIPLIPIHVDMDGLTNGMYIIEMVTDDQKLTEKLILSR